MIQDEVLQVFVELGLSVSQAKVYLSLVEMGQLPVEEVSKLLNLDRSDVRRVMFELQELGLVEEVPAPSVIDPSQVKRNP